MPFNKLQKSILLFFLNNPTKHFTLTYLKKKFNKPKASVFHALRILEGKGYLIHNGGYYLSTKIDPQIQSFFLERLYQLYVDVSCEYDIFEFNELVDLFNEDVFRIIHRQKLRSKKK